MVFKIKYQILIFVCIFAKLSFAEDPIELQCFYRDFKFPYEEEPQYQCNLQKDFTLLDDTLVTSSNNHVGTKTNADVTVLTIVNKKIFQIPNLSAAFTKLSYINIQNTPLRYLKKKYIEGYKANLKHFVVTGSKVEVIDKDLFAGFSKLETIDLKQNEIFYIHGEAFKDLPLNVLKLTRNKCNVDSTDIGDFNLNERIQTLEEYVTKISISTCAPIDAAKLLEKYQESKVALDYEAFEKEIEHDEFLNLKEQETKKCEKSKIGLEESEKKAKEELEKVKNDNDLNLKTISNLKINADTLIKSRSDAIKELSALKVQIEKLQSDAEKCLDVKGTCRFTKDSTNGYSCIARNFSITTPGTEIVWSGDHDPKTMQNKNVESLIINNMNVQYVPKNIADTFFRLQTLIIEKCGLRKLTQNDFFKLFFVTKIKITSNNISTIDAGAFDEVSSLETLDLSDNQIQSLPLKIFEKLEYLNTLKLDKNHLTTMKADLLAASNNIIHFSATNNKLKSVESGFVWRLRKAELIDFSGNEKCDKIYDSRNANILTYIGFYGVILNNC